MNEPTQDLDLKVPKRSKQVELLFVDGRTFLVDLFLAEKAASTACEEQLLDLLSDDSIFLPARDIEHDAYLLFRRDAIRWVSIGVDSDAVGELHLQCHNVSIECIGGQTLDGKLLYSPPATHTRVKDHLNEPENFFQLWTADRHYLVNKAQVLRVRDLPHKHKQQEND